MKEKKVKEQKKVLWYKRPQPNNYPAARSYLNLIYDEVAVTTLIARLKKAPLNEVKAKDIFRASGHSLLGISNYHVAKDRKKIKKGLRLSPLLLVRHSPHGKVIIADGYHRMCAVYSFNEDAVVPGKIA
jgi:hypothetical protein